MVLAIRPASTLLPAILLHSQALLPVPYNAYVTLSQVEGTRLRAPSKPTCNDLRGLPNSNEPIPVAVSLQRFDVALLSRTAQYGLRLSSYLRALVSDAWRTTSKTIPFQSNSL